MTPRPTQTTRTTQLVVSMIAMQLLFLPVILLAVPRPWAELVCALSVPVAGVIAAVPIHHRPTTGWLLVWTQWQRRRWSARRASHADSNVNPLWVLDHQLVLGSIVGPRSGEIGVMHRTSGWVSAIWVTDGPQPAAEQPRDGLAQLLALPSPPSPAVALRAVLQQSSPEDGDSDALLITAWLVVHVNPFLAMSPDLAIGAVPGLIRGELRRLMNVAEDGALAMVSLDKSDLVGALATSVEIPPERAAPGSRQVEESWRRWHARGRHHEAFAVRPASMDSLAATLGLVLDGAGLRPGTTVTASLRYGEGDGRLRRYPLVARVSHRDPLVTDEVSAHLRQALADRGDRCLDLNGVQGPALLATSILAGDTLT